jgi:hypothetical protein
VITAKYSLLASSLPNLHPLLFFVFTKLNRRGRGPLLKFN